jgi:hypothetical protein
MFERLRRYFMYDPMVVLSFLFQGKDFLVEREKWVEENKM